MKHKVNIVFRILQIYFVLSVSPFINFVQFSILSIFQFCPILSNFWQYFLAHGWLKFLILFMHFIFTFCRLPNWFAQQLKATQHQFQQFLKSLQKITPTIQQKTLFFVVPRECSTLKIFNGLKISQNFTAVIMLILCLLICSLWLKKKAFASKLRTYFIFFESCRFHSVWKSSKKVSF